MQKTLAPIAGTSRSFSTHPILRQELLARFENGKLTWPSNEEEVKALTSEQVDWLMKGFSIIPKINVSKSRDFY